MAFQSSVSSNQSFGIVGEILTDGPLRCAPYTLVSTPQTNNIGRAYTVSSEGVATVGGTGVFAGILVHPKHYASLGTSAGGTLAPSLILPDNQQGELLTMGTIIVNLGTTANIGDAVKYNYTTGVLGVCTPSTGETAVPNTKVVRYTVGSNGIAVIELTN